MDALEGYNVELRALRVYAVSRRRGVEFVEPAHDAALTSDEEGVRRIDEYLLAGRAPVPGEKKDVA
jgi:hypothetical protein